MITRLRMFQVQAFPRSILICLGLASFLIAFSK